MNRRVFSVLVLAGLLCTALGAEAQSEEKQAANQAAAAEKETPYAMADPAPGAANLGSLPLAYAMQTDILNLGVNPKSAFEQMKTYMADVEKAFDIMIARLNMQRGRLVTSSLANEKQDEELEYRKKIMEKLNLDYTALKQQLKADEDKLEALESKLKAIKEKNRLLNLAASQEEKLAQDDMDRIQKEKDKLTNLEMQWKNNELTLNSRFQIQAAELQQVLKRIAETAGELKYLKKVLSKYQVDFQTERQILLKEDLMMKRLNEKMEATEQELKKLNDLHRHLTAKQTDAERERLKEKYQQEAVILKNKGAMEIAMRTLNEQLAKLQEQKAKLSEDRKTMDELDGKLRELNSNEAAQKYQAKIQELEAKHKEALAALTVKYQGILDGKKNEIDNLKAQAETQAKQISNLESQVANLKEEYSDRVETPVTTPCENPPPCIQSPDACACSKSKNVRRVVVSEGHADVSDENQVD